MIGLCGAPVTEFKRGDVVFIKYASECGWRYPCGMRKSSGGDCAESDGQ